jgi:hypothetical protein
MCRKIFVQEILTGWDHLGRPELKLKKSVKVDHGK